MKGMIQSATLVDINSSPMFNITSQTGATEPIGSSFWSTEHSSLCIKPTTFIDFNMVKGDISTKV